MEAMIGSRANVCQRRATARGTPPGLIALLFPLVFAEACDASERDGNPAGESGGSAGTIAGSSGSTSGRGADGGSSGRGADGGSSGSSGRSGAGAGGDGGSSGIAGGDCNSVSPPTSACGSCEPWPEGCEVTCATPMGACLVADGTAPAAPYTLEAQVTSVGTAPWPSSRCIGHAAGDATRLSLMDAAGETWSLSFPADMVGLDRFAEGADLVIEHEPWSGFAFHERSSLIVSEQGEVVAFAFSHDVVDFDVPGTDLKMEVGEMACPRSLPGLTGCSRMSFHTRARRGQEVATDPCATRVGDMIVSSALGGEEQAPADCRGLQGFCDGAMGFFVAGVRVE